MLHKDESFDQHPSVCQRLLALGSTHREIDGDVAQVAIEEKRILSNTFEGAYKSLS